MIRSVIDCKKKAHGNAFQSRTEAYVDNSHSCKSNAAVNKPRIFRSAIAREQTMGKYPLNYHSRAEYKKIRQPAHIRKDSQLNAEPELFI